MPVSTPYPKSKGTTITFAKLNGMSRAADVPNVRRSERPSGKRVKKVTQTLLDSISKKSVIAMDA